MSQKLHTATAEATARLVRTGLAMARLNPPVVMHEASWNDEDGPGTVLVEVADATWIAFDLRDIPDAAHGSAAAAAAIRDQLDSLQMTRSELRSAMATVRHQVQRLLPRGEGDATPLRLPSLQLATPACWPTPNRPLVDVAVDLPAPNGGGRRRHRARIDRLEGVATLEAALADGSGTAG